MNSEDISTCQKWKEDAARKGYTLMEIADWCEKIGLTEYAQELRNGIVKMEGVIMDFGIGLEKGPPGYLVELKTDFESVEALDEKLDETEESILLEIFPELADELHKDAEQLSTSADT